MDLAPFHHHVDGQRFDGFLADGAGDRQAAGVLVVHEGPGLGAHTIERARRLAELGYVAYAMDLYGERDLSIERAKEQVRALRADRPALRSRMVAALDRLRAHPTVDPARTAAIGYCFGGTAALELARSGADVSCVVGFHAGLDAGDPADARAIRCKVLVCTGEDDPIVDAAQRAAFVEEMSDAGVDWQLVLYGGVGHSFTNPDIDAYGFPGFAYHELADRRSWRAMRALFEEAWAVA